MPKAQKAKAKNKVYSVPSTQKRKDGGSVPKLNTTKMIGRQAMPYGKSKPIAPGSNPTQSIQSLLDSARNAPEESADGPSTSYNGHVDLSLTTRDSSSKAFMRELRKIIERSDVIIQVLDARDPDGTRSRWIEEEVRKRELEGKKLLAVVNKIDLVPRANLEAWLKHLRHSFPTMPFKSSTQAQRQNLSQNAVPLAAPASVPGQTQTHQALPTTSSSLGAPALLHLLKQYSLSTPHSSLTVGVVGYPNVGKSSLINSLKRSRACAVAAMPGKTRVVQEVVIDKGVKILDCPGVVLEDVGREMEGEAGRIKAAEIMLRNCVKAELVEDPVAPVEVILNKVDPALLLKLYNIPPYADVREFLIRIALTRGRLGKGGIPDLQGSAVSVLRDWNSGKIPYYTKPPAVHPSSAPSTAPAASTEQTLSSGDVEMGAGAGPKVGDAQILTTLTEAFTLDGLFDNLGDEAAWEGEEELAEDAEAMAEERPFEEPEVAAPAPAFKTANPFSMPTSDDESEDEMDGDDDDDEPRFGARSFPPAPRPAEAAPVAQVSQPLHRRGPAINVAKLFSAEELAVLPEGMLDRQKQKQLAKRAKKKRAAAERTEGELMAGFIDMDVEEPPADGDMVMEVGERLSKRQLRKQKQRDQRDRQRAVRRPVQPEPEVNMEAKKEADFASFLAQVGGDDMDEEL